MSYTAEAIEAVSKHFNSADMTEGRMLRKIMREIRPHIDEIDLSVLLFIFDRTYTYGKQAEGIPTSHFLNGVKTASGELLHPPLRCSRSSLFRSIKKLIANVIIVSGKTHRTGTVTYAINPAWVPPFSVTQTLASVRGGLASVNTGLTSVRAGTHNSIDNNRHDVQQVALRASAREEDMTTAKERLLATVAGATAKNKAARTKTKNKQNATGLMKIWEDAFIGIHPEETYFRWRTFEQAAFKKAVERGVPSDHVEDFIIFCVTAFDNVINEHFSWMKSKPTIPAVGFVTKHIAEFYQSFNDSKDPNRKLRGRIKRTEVTDAPKKADANERAEVERLKAEVASLKSKLGEKAGSRRLKLRKRIANRPDADPEFGTYD
jgi:hypothetical protein